MDCPCVGEDNSQALVNGLSQYTHTLVMGPTGAVVSTGDNGPRGPLFETWPGRNLLWP